MPGLPCLLYFSDQGFHGGEVDFETVMTGLDGQRDGQMGFADSRRTEKNDVFMVLDKGEIKKFHHRSFAQMRMKGEIVTL